MVNMIGFRLYILVTFKDDSLKQFRCHRARARQLLWTSWKTEASYQFYDNSEKMSGPKTSILSQLNYLGMCLETPY